MAITFLKKPLTYFNVFEPAIFEFSSDADLGVNTTELVADLQITSLQTDRKYLIKNIPPNYGTGVFRVDVSGYLKSLMLDNFEYDFDSDNKKYAIEEYAIGVYVHSENATDTTADEYVFDSGYIFDTSFVFADTAPNDTTSENFFAILGVTNFGDSSSLIFSTSENTLLTPYYSEFAVGFTNTISRYLLDTTEGMSTLSTVLIPDNAIEGFTIPTKLNAGSSTGEKIGILYQPDNCEDTIQLRFFNSYGGYSYLYGARDAEVGSRTGSKFVNNNFYNIQDGKTPQKLRTSTRKKSITVSGNKILGLFDTFQELLNSPSIFVLLDSGYVECSVSGNASRRKYDFEFSLTITLDNINTMDL